MPQAHGRYTKEDNKVETLQKRIENTLLLTHAQSVNKI